jgi:CRISPR-associated protein Csd2
MTTEIVSHRHDIFILFDVKNGNPNGDPDAGNLPRIDPTTNKGLVSDVCLKRKVRNYVLDFHKDDGEAFKNGQNGYDILVRQGTIISNELKAAIDKATEKQTNDKKKAAEAAMKWLCRKFYDIRMFGGVLAVGDDVLKGSAFGQVRGPVQFTFGQSYDPITPLEISITRCAVTKPEDEKKERTMGNKHIVPYALYVAKAFVSPVFAERTGFTNDDLDLFFEALQNLFTHDQSAARAEMIVRGIYDFEHVGTQHPNNGAQNAAEAKLGCWHAHKLFDGIKVELKDSKKEFPESFDDYKVQCDWTDATMPKGVCLNLRHEQPLITVKLQGQ